MEKLDKFIFDEYFGANHYICELREKLNEVIELINTQESNKPTQEREMEDDPQHG